MIFSQQIRDKKGTNDYYFTFPFVKGINMGTCF